MSARWVETEEWAAAWFRGELPGSPGGWPFAVRAGRGKRGRDLVNMPGLNVEIKAFRDQADVLKALRQAAGVDGGVPLVIERPQSYGLEKIGLWPVTFRLRDATTLLRDAGYGTDKED